MKNVVGRPRCANVAPERARNERRNDVYMLVCVIVESRGDNSDGSLDYMLQLYTCLLFIYISRAPPQ